MASHIRTNQRFNQFYFMSFFDLLAFLHNLEYDVSKTAPKRRIKWNDLVTTMSFSMKLACSNRNTLTIPIDISNCTFSYYNAI